MGKIDDLILYKIYYNFMDYSYMLVRKYPVSERYFLTADIKTKTNEGLVLVCKVNSEYDKYKKIGLLKSLLIIIEILEVYFRLSKKYKYINRNNYMAASSKLTALANNINGLIKTCKV